MLKHGNSAVFENLINSYLNVKNVGTGTVLVTRRTAVTALLTDLTGA
jgi:hypothetical protein